MISSRCVFNDPTFSPIVPIGTPANSAVDMNTLDPGDVEITHINLNDQTLEGMRHKTLPAFSVQYHPEAAPGPHDSRYLFEQFIEDMKTFHA